MIAAKSDFRNVNWQSALQVIPSTWVLTPLLGNKAPYRSGWQTEAPLAREVILSDLLSGKAQGVGIRTGIISGGLVAIDLDGESAHQYVLDHLSGGEDLPKTVAFTSGRPGRSQHLYSIPQQYWDAIQTKKLKTGANGDDGKPEQVELRWDGCQSVLPPSAHPITGEYRWVNNCSPAECEIASAPAWLIEKMLVEVSTPQVNYSHSSPQGAWADIEWALSYLNATAPSRADDYDDWLAVGMALHSVDDSLLTEWDKWSRQSSKYKPGDCEKKWKSFKRSGKNIGSLAHMAKQDGWKSPFQKAEYHRPDKVVSLSTWNKNGGGGGNKPPQQEISAYSKVKGIVDAGLSQARVESELIELSLSTGLNLNGLKTLYRQIEAESVMESSQEDNSKEVNKLVDYRGQTLDLKQIFPAPLAHALNTKAESDRLDPVYLYSHLLPILGLKLGGNIAIEGKEGATTGDSWLEYPIFYTVVVAPPSHGKSNSMRAIHSSVKEQQRQDQVEYKQQKETYDELTNAWKEKSPEERDHLKDSDKNPEIFKKTMKQPCLRLMTGGTPEGILKQTSELPSGAGVALVMDELARFCALDQYKNGGGDSRQLFMEAWNGPCFAPILRSKQQDTYYLQGQCINLSGGIQPAKAKTLLSDPEDGDGLLSRFLISQPTTPDSFAEWTDLKVNLNERLKSLYDALEKLHYDLRSQAFGDSAEFSIENNIPVVLKFTPEATKRWQGWWSNLRRQMVKFEHENPAMFGVLGKMLSQTLRLALGLHCLELVYEDKPNPLLVGLDTLERAIKCATYHIGQFRLLQANNDGTDNLPTQLVKIYQYGERKGTAISAAQVQNTIFKRQERKTPLAQIREQFHQLVAAGLGVLEGAGRNLKFLARKIVGIPTQIRQNSGIPEAPENLTTQQVEELAKENSDFSDTSPPFAPPLPEVEDVSTISTTTEMSEESENFDEDTPKPHPMEVVDTEPLSDLESEPAGNSDVLPNSDEAETIPSGTGFGKVTPQPNQPDQPKQASRPLAVGDRVFWDSCPAHLSSWSPFTITKIDGQFAELDIVAHLVSLDELSLE